MSAVKRKKGGDNIGAPLLENSLQPDGTPDLTGDKLNILLLCLLYILQGIPLGLTAAIPLILINHSVTFKQQAEFSFAFWPFSVKLLWAPLVDSIYVEKFGKRKTWLVPAQYLIGIFMIFLSMNINHWLGSTELKEEPQVMLLTVLFFSMNFLAATQDIALDGWALTMLKRSNKSYASTCNSVGQTAGYFLGYVVFMALESAEFCNSYLRQVPEKNGIVTLPGFLFFWGVCFLVITSLVAVFKTERPEPASSESTSVKAALSSYKLLWSIIKMRNVQFFAFMLLTAKIGFAACDGLTGLKLIQKGIPKEKLALLAVPLVPLQIVLPILIAKYSERGRPLNLYVKVIPYRLCFNFLAAFFVYLTPIVLAGVEGIPMYYYFMLLLLLAIHQMTMTAMFVQIMAFFALISDPAAGGTYMTLLNTLCNLGGTWSTTLALWCLDFVTFKYCSTSGLECSGLEGEKLCNSTNDGVCEIHIDGYYIEAIICTIIGFIWYRYGKNPVKNLQSYPLSSWKVRNYDW